MPHIQGVHRDAVILFPPTLDEYITAENPVRCIDAFVDELDLHALGFQRALANHMGRPAYAPGDLLKLYLYGYLNRIRSSRLLERESQRNVEVMWLLKKLTPDFKTIADFRKNNLEPLKQVCRTFTLLCKELDLFGGELIAIDGCKFKAVNNYERNFTSERLSHLLQAVDTRIEAYLAELNQADAQTSPVPQLVGYLEEKLARLRERKEHYQALSEQLQQSEQTQISLTDSDSRSMIERHKTMVGYNVQFATDAKHKLIVDHEVTNAVTDQHQLAPIAQRAKTILGVDSLNALADRG
jgi:transposase